MRDRLILGWDIGGTKSSAVVGTGQGEIRARMSWPSLAERGPEAMLADFFKAAREFETQYGPFASAGVSVGGPLDPMSGVILSPPHLPGWDRFPLRERLSGELGLPVRVEHDAVACLLAEYLWGGARGMSHAVYLTSGTGFGAGILLDGWVVRGARGQTVEIGHVRLSDRGPVLYGKAGCAESFCSGAGISLLAHELFPEQFSGPVPLPELEKRCLQGEEAAREVLLAAARATGRVCAMLGDLFSPEVVIVGSLARYLPEWWLEEIRAEFGREVLPYNGAHCQIIRTVLGKRLQDLSSIAPCVYHAEHPER